MKGRREKGCLERDEGEGRKGFKGGLTQKGSGRSGGERQ